MSKEYTTEEIRNKLLDHIWSIINYWEKEKDKSEKEKIEGVVFSIPSMLDGSSYDLPAFIIAPDPHPDDKEYLVSKNEKYYPENHKLNIKGNISGGLHELFYKRRK